MDVVLVKDSDDDLLTPTLSDEVNATIILSDEEVVIMDKKDRIPFLDLDPPSPSPPKQSKVDQGSRGQLKSTIQRPPKIAEDQQAPETEEEDGEIVSSPELTAADIEIKINEQVSSSESEHDDSKPIVPENDVIQILDTPEKEAKSEEKREEEFPQKEQPSVNAYKKGGIAVVVDDEEVEMDHLEIKVAQQVDLKQIKLKLNDKKGGSPKGKYPSPEKDNRSNKRYSPRDDANRKRPYDVFDERRNRPDSEYEDKHRRSEKRNEDQEDLRKRLLKKLGSDNSRKESRDDSQKDTKEDSRKEVREDLRKDTRDKDVRDDSRKTREKTNHDKNSRSRLHDDQSSDVKTKLDVNRSKDKHKHSSSENERNKTEKKDKHRKHEDKSKKKKKRKHKEETASEVIIQEEVILEKSPVILDDNVKYDDISSDNSEHSAAVALSKSPLSTPNHSPSNSPVPSLSRSPSRSPTPEQSPTPQRKRTYFPGIEGCRSVEEFAWLNRIEEGTYGVVYRAKDKRTDEIVALKRLKMEKEREGFPITSLREINTLLKAQHPNIVTVREIVVGNNMDKIYIVMDYVEHDLKALMETMTQPFLVGEVKTLLLQLLRGVRHMHDNWILHRDIKASNLLLSHQGILKIGDFGLAREYGSPLKKYTSIVVTLWYRAPELLLGTKEYSTAIDLWSVGCVFAELLTMKPLFPGKSEIDQINRIFKELGTPNDKIWPGPPAYSEHPQVKKMNIAEHPYNILRQRFGATLTDRGFDLLNSLLTYDPARRISADEGIRHAYFQEAPKPVDPSMFPTWPAKSELGHKVKKNASPKPPSGGGEFRVQMGDENSQQGGFHMPSTTKGSSAKSSGFNLKFD